jgi:ABC-type transport system involved in cytochrome c biogenesis permease subunit
MLQYKKNAGLFADEARPQAVLTPLFKYNVRYWFFVYPAIVLPSWAAALWVLAVRIVNRLDKAAGFPLLYCRILSTDAHRSGENLYDVDTGK